MNKKHVWAFAAIAGVGSLAGRFTCHGTEPSPVDKWIADPTASLAPLRIHYQHVYVEQWVPLSEVRPADRDAGVAVWDRKRNDEVDRVRLGIATAPGFLKKFAAEKGLSAGDLTPYLIRDVEPDRLPKRFTGTVQTRAYDGSLVSVILNDGHEVVTIYLMNGRIAKVFRGHSDI